MSDRAREIRELERRLAELREQAPERLTAAEIRALSDEEVDTYWERERSLILADQAAEDVSPQERLRRAYGGAEGADALASGAAVRDRRRNRGGDDDDAA
jgi:hypothetical protein